MVEVIPLRPTLVDRTGLGGTLRGWTVRAGVVLLAVLAGSDALQAQAPSPEALYEQGWDLSSRSRAVDNSG